jgi:hypothetical protein
MEKLHIMVDRPTIGISPTLHNTICKSADYTRMVEVCTFFYVMILWQHCGDFVD